MEKLTELYDLSSDDEYLDDTLSKENNCSSSDVCQSPGQVPTDTIKYTTANIKTFLKEQPDKYVLVENRKVNPTKPAPCWNRFALPALKNENGSNTIIRNFATCRSCYTTYSYLLGSTKSLNAHRCAPSTSSSPSSRYFRYKNLIIYYICISSIKSSWKSRIDRFCVEKKQSLTPAIAKWICESMRPLSIVEDEGFLNIIQQCLCWNGGEKYRFIF